MIEFDWLIHYKCNFRCPYCFFSNYWNEVEKKNVDISYIKWIHAYKKIYNKYGDIKVIITGGEPTLFKNFKSLIIELNKFADVSFDTNLSINCKNLEDLVSNIDNSKLFIGASFHPGFAKTDEFIKKMLILKKYNINSRVHFVTYPQNLSMMSEVKKICLDQDIRFVPIPFRGQYKNKIYPVSFTQEEKNLIYDITNDIKNIDKKWSNVQVEQVDSKNKLCRAGQMYARVDCDGTVYPCANDFKETGGRNILGNLLDEKFEMKKEPMVCSHDKCPCEFRWIVK